MIENSAYFAIKQLSNGNYQGTNARKSDIPQSFIFQS